MPITMGPKGGASSKPQSERGTSTPEVVDWERSFLNHGMSPEAAKTAAGYIAQGIDPAVAIHITYKMGLDKAPMSQWDDFARNNPGQATAKKLLVTGGRAMGDTVGGALNTPGQNAHEMEKVSAAKMLKEYLMHQDAQRAGDMTKQALWQQVQNQQIAQAQGQDQFFMDNKRPPASLGDFVQAGANQALPQLQVGPAEVQPPVQLNVGPAQVTKRY